MLASGSGWAAGTGLGYRKFEIWGGLWSGSCGLWFNFSSGGWKGMGLGYPKMGGGTVVLLHRKRNSIQALVGWQGRAWVIGHLEEILIWGWQGRRTLGGGFDEFHFQALAGGREWAWVIGHLEEVLIYEFDFNPALAGGRDGPGFLSNIDRGRVLVGNND
ncbi:hypothetical protein ASPWEDRAFT_31683 [Aspergillus wentii DTO 134E9]|uniref:Uncharacterized protein n=1 Tax=Aspergillus wentii DTO 134E9 TaxID=1073089 RepID=A0A1L9R7U8_ASPWE|nr:uncharacterized protein ASPWEDRAFT_31683 [Aspergillus wentii DTO 134E9]OJJ30996.1 hypothetical protein ASPWEDRAFT_31683 [Aspergillus wentii DTO 134E9]